MLHSAGMVTYTCIPENTRPIEGKDSRDGKMAHLATALEAVQTLSQHFYMPNRPIALVERAQTAINYIANCKSASSDMEGFQASCPPLHTHIAQQAGQIPV
jgi:hypothetical protein